LDVAFQPRHLLAYLFGVEVFVEAARASGLLDVQLRGLCLFLPVFGLALLQELEEETGGAALGR
jgi:hypothetical protein